MEHNLSHSEALNEIGAALAKAQGKIKAAHKDSTNPHYKSRYADLASIWEACRTELSEAGIAVVQSPSTQGKVVSIATMLIHTSGQWLKGVLSAEARDGQSQSIGSAITYLRRYSLASFVSVTPDDDDGEAAMAPPEKKSYAPRQTPPPISSIPIPPPPAATIPLFDKENTQQVIRLTEQLAQLNVSEDMLMPIMDLMHGQPMSSGTLKAAIARALIEES